MKRVVIATAAVSVAAVLVIPFLPRESRQEHEARPVGGSAARPEPPVRVVDSLVRVDAVAAAPAVAHVPGPAPSRRPPRRTHLVRAPRHRSLLARLFLGDGDRRPRPFPRPQ